MLFTLKTFDELSANELYELLQLRAEIFVVEQNCAYQDLDEKDKKALHLMGYNRGKLISYARILAPGVSYKEASIGRVVVAISYRKKGTGKELMHEAIKATLEKFKTNEIVISAQQYLERFYSDLNFVTESESYLEDNIPHVKMRLRKLSA